MRRGNDGKEAAIVRKGLGGREGMVGGIEGEGEKREGEIECRIKERLMDKREVRGRKGSGRDWKEKIGRMKYRIGRMQNYAIYVTVQQPWSTVCPFNTI